MPFVNEAVRYRPCVVLAHADEAFASDAFARSDAIRISSNTLWRLFVHPPSVPRATGILLASISRNVSNATEKRATHAGWR